MAINKRDMLRAKRRASRVRMRLRLENSLPRVSVFRSLNHIYAQLINDQEHSTITSCSSLELKNLTGDKKAIAQAVGRELGKRMKEKGIQAAMFDRGCYRYHGRVQALVDGIRESGLHI